VPNLNSRILAFFLLGRAWLIAFRASFRLTPRSLKVVRPPLRACLPPSSKPIPVRLISRAPWPHRSCAYQSFRSFLLANRTMMYRLRRATSRARFALYVRAVLQASSRAQGMLSAATWRTFAVSPLMARGTHTHIPPPFLDAATRITLLPHPSMDLFHSRLCAPSHTIDGHLSLLAASSCNDHV